MQRRESLPAAIKLRKIKYPVVFLNADSEIPTCAYLQFSFYWNALPVPFPEKRRMGDVHPPFFEIISSRAYWLI